MFGLCCLIQHQYVGLPLVKTRVSASLNDLTARVTLSQIYSNTSNQTPIEAIYVFPIPERAAVCSFEMVKEDGHKVVGIVQEKEEAKATYDKAVEEGKLASLMEQSTPDIFKVTVGNILPNEKVTINLSYVTELTEDETLDSIRFHVPAHIGARYGSPPPSTSSITALSAQEDPFLTLECTIQSLSPISRIGCPSHKIETSLGPDPSLPNFKDLPFSNYAKVTLNSESPIDRDFILTITSAGLDSPRCLLERHPTSSSIAMGLTMVPRFKLPDIPSQEFIFVIDRSGSMGPWGSNGNPRIEVAKKALVCALRALPAKGTCFNIVSFGSSYSKLWSNSRDYDQKSLEEATKHTDSIEANMGGTELRAALEHVISTRKTDRPTSVFLLTDGDTYDLQNTSETVKKGVAATASSSAYLRIFVLGIGNSASTAMCESIARLGNGSSSSVVDGESFTGKTNRLIKAARSPMIKNIRVDWGVEKKEKGEDDDGFELLSDTESESTLAEPKSKEPENEKKKINLFDSDVDPLKKDSTPVPPQEPIKLAPPPPVQQSPFNIRNLSPGSRLYVYSIISPPLWNDKSSVPKFVTLKGNVDDENEVELEIPVTLSNFSAEDSDLPPPLHTIAAKKLIQDLSDGSHSYGDIQDDDKKARTVKAAIVRLGTTYNLASEHTSFVAVDESEVGKGVDRKIQTRLPDVSQLYGGGVQQQQCRSSSAGGPIVLAKARSVFGGFGLGGGGLRRDRATGPPAPAPMAVPGTLMCDSGSPAVNFDLAYAAPPPMAFSSPAPSGGALFGNASTSPPGGALFGSVSPQVQQQFSGFSYGGQEKEEMKRKKASPVTASFAAPRTALKPAVGFKSVNEKAGVFASDADRLDALVREQSFTGSFNVGALQVCKASATPSQLVGSLPAELATSKDAETIAITLYVLAYLEKKLQGEKDAWEAVAEKAKDFVESAGGKNSVEDLIQKFVQLV